MTLSPPTLTSAPPKLPIAVTQNRKDGVSLTGRSASRLLRQNAISDVYSIGLQVDQLLREGLSETLVKLNRVLIAEVRVGFENWLIVTRKDLLAQIKKVPQHARERWLRERLEHSGLSIQWFTDLGVIKTGASQDGTGCDALSADEQSVAADERLEDQQGLRLLADFLLHHSRVLVTSLVRLKSGNKDFRRNMAVANSQAEREQVILRYAQQMGSGGRNLRRDHAAFRRWFDEEAVNDRFVKQLGHKELLLSFVMDRLGNVLDQMFHLVRSRNPAVSNLQRLWERLAVEDRISAVWNHDGDPRVRSSALECLSRVIRVLPADCRIDLLSQRFVAELNRAAFKGNLDVWIQCRALDVLVEMQPRDAAALLTRRVSHIRGGDDLFVRRHALQLLEHWGRNGLCQNVTLPPSGNEPSDFVRQQFARAAFFCDNESNRRHWIHLAHQDPVPQVRAAAILVATELDGDVARRFDALECIATALRTETDPFVVRVALHSACLVLRETCPPRQEEPFLQVSEYYRQRICPAIESLIASAESTPVRRYAAQARERIWVTLDQDARKLLEAIEPVIRKIPIGRTKRFRADGFKGLSDQKLGRILASIAIDDFGFDVHRKPWGVYITRGPVFGLRLWRILYEATHTATDKRQALRHTVGRINAAPLRITSQICGELSETKVPGEPLTISNDGTWRPFLPLVDDFVAVLNQSWFRAKTIPFVTAQGVTRVTAPKSLIWRCIAASRLNLGFAGYANSRNWDDDSFQASTYINSLRKLGFTIQYESHDQGDPTTDDSTVLRFFAAGHPTTSRSLRSRVADFFVRKRDNASDGQREPVESSATRSRCLAGDEPCQERSLAVAVIGGSGWNEYAGQWFERFQDYFAAAFENTLEHLLLFTVAVILIVVAKHFWSNIQLRRARSHIPLSIGGWGTRGKSGTERLKAALIGAMGYGLVSKTTGCEAMFIHADAYSEPLEIPLFRPFDKATIWEQSNLLRTVARMNPSVFLWECMALTPSYVDVLQRQWTCDDLATITNTYPDHEDVQGPAGHDVATTIAGFVPQRSRMISTEEQMRPYVTESCREAKTSFRGVGWLESGLVTQDILARFPYKEHPDNIALVAVLGEELGVTYDAAVKAMGDYLVPDLGVLKTHPVAQVQTRKIEFTNGMSANERFGCMGNWKRLGFDRQDPWDHPTTWVCGVVNNRADRVPRSKVFAKILVEDLGADRFFLIGNNLEGLRGFIEDAWLERAETLTLRDSGHGNRWDRQFALDTLLNSAREFRQVINRDQLKARLSASVQAALLWTGADASSVMAHLDLWMDDPQAISKALADAGVSTKLVESVSQHQNEWLTSIVEYEKTERRIRTGSEADVPNIETEFASMLRIWLCRKLVILHNYDATGEEVVSVIVDETPPGFTNRAIGLQNIKGTGLDFVYRFQAWDTCHEACMAALSVQPSVAARGLEALVAMPAIGQLCEQAMWSVLNQTRQSKALLRPDLQTLIQTLEQRLKRITTSGQMGMPLEKTPDIVPLDEKAEPTNVRNAKRSKWNEWLIRYCEELLDLTDSLRRRQKADLVYRDLADGRIGRQRAISVLRSINKRQKGGWLVK